MSAAVEVTDLRKTYDGRAALDGLSFTVERGEVFGIVGPNGAGKTTTVEILEGYRTPGAGRARVLGLDPRRDARALRPRMGVMLQEDGLYPGLRAGEALSLFAAYYDDPLAPGDLLEAVGLSGSGRTAVRRLSGGQRRRLSLALALVGRPEIAFLDEPTAGMDPRGRAAAWEVVGSLRDRGATVVLTTHAMDEAETLADRLAVVDRGRLAALGSPAELTTGPADEARFTARPGLDTAALATALGLAAGAVTEERAGHYVIAAAGSPDLVVRLAGWLAERDVALGDLRAGRASLEDVFLRLTAEPSAAEASAAEAS